MNSYRTKLNLNKTIKAEFKKNPINELETRVRNVILSVERKNVKTVKFVKITSSFSAQDTTNRN